MKRQVHRVSQLTYGIAPPVIRKMLDTEGDNATAVCASLCTSMPTKSVRIFSSVVISSLKNSLLMWRSGEIPVCESHVPGCPKDDRSDQSAIGSLPRSGERRGGNPPWALLA
jgi:hypothetical protein